MHFVKRHTAKAGRIERTRDRVPLEQGRLRRFGVIGDIFTALDWL